MTEDKPNDDVDDVVDQPITIPDAAEDITATALTATDPSEQVASEINNTEKLKTSVQINQNLWLRFRELVYKKYGYDAYLQDTDYETEFERVVLVGLNHCLGDIETTSSTSLLFDGKKPRKDVLINLAKIATWFLNQDRNHFRRNEIVSVIRTNLGHVDKRTVTKYLSCIEQHSIKDTVSGTFNIESFCRLIPQDYQDGRDTL